MCYRILIMLPEFEFNRFKKVLGVGQSEYHNITQYTCNRDHQGCLPKVTQSLKSKIFKLKISSLF